MMKNLMIILSVIIAFFTGICFTSLLKKEKVIFVHKNLCEGICIPHREAYGIEEGLDDINYYVAKIASGDTTNPWLDRIIERCDYINEQIK